MPVDITSRIEVHVYIPLFGKHSPSRVSLIVINFYLLLFLYVIGTNVATSRLKQSDQVHRWAHRIAPIVIIGIGLVILLSQ
jgi:cadmium resistance protein CadD (predicted permease)